MEWLQSLGYLGVFVGAVLEGEIVIVTFIQLARLGYLNLYWVIGLFSLGTLVTDWTFFFIGRKNGRRYIKNHPKLKGQFEKMDGLMNRRKQLLLLTYRFMYGFRFILPILFGFSSVRIRQFIFYSVLGNIVWVGCFASLGYFFSELVLEYLERIQANLLYIFLIMGGVALLIWFFVKGRFILIGRKRK